jgi:hypothetical protein
MSNYLKTKEYCSWNLCENLYAIKKIDESIILDGKIFIPNEMGKFFNIDDYTNCSERRITVSYLDGEYSFWLKTNVKSGEHVLEINGDFYSTLIGIWNCVIQDKNAGEIYIAFFKVGNDSYESRIGMENKNKR